MEVSDFTHRETFIQFGGDAVISLETGIMSSEILRTTQTMTLLIFRFTIHFLGWTTEFFVTCARVVSTSEPQAIDTLTRRFTKNLKKKEITDDESRARPAYFQFS